MKSRLFRLVVAMLTAVLCLSLVPVGAFAASNVTAKDGKVIAYAPGSAFSNTDLFDNFKNVLPGDVITQSIYVENKVYNSAYIKVYIRALPHDYTTNPVQPAVNSQLTNDTRRGTTDNLAYMNDFLSQLGMSVYNGSALVSSGTASTSGGLTNYVYLGSLNYGQGLNLTANLQIPTTLSSKYNNRIGEVDWQFLVEAYDSNGNPYTPGWIPTKLAQTGQIYWPIPILALFGAQFLLVGFFVSRRKKK